jgi:hypothetical protein
MEKKVLYFSLGSVAVSTSSQFSNDICNRKLLIFSLLYDLRYSNLGIGGGLKNEENVRKTHEWSENPEFKV